MAFNERSDLVKSYSNNPAFVSAYSLFFLPTNIPKLSFIFDACPPEVSELFKNESWEFIDFGSGPGTYSLAWLGLFPNSKVKLIDKSNLMLAQARKFISDFFGEKSFENFGSEKSKKILCFGNVINEIQARAAIIEVQKTQAEAVLLIEPGTKKSFEQVLLMQESLISRGYECHYPCPSSGNCPMIVDKENWCHQVLRTTHDPSIERIGQLSKKDRKILPFIGHLYIKKELVIKKESEFRSVRFLGQNKFSFEYEVCHQNQAIKKLIVPKKKLDAKGKKFFKKGSIGMNIPAHIDYVLKD